MSPRSDARADGEAQWRRIPPDRLPEPIEATVPYVELKLEHPDLEAERSGDRFFPDVVPYRLGSEHRIFAWRSVLPERVPSARAWRGLCATTESFVPMLDDHVRPDVTRQCGGVRELVVDGTIGGDSTTVPVADYEPPQIDVKQVDGEAVVVGTPTEEIHVPAGERTTVDLRARTIACTTTDEVTTTPRLQIRFPGVRTIYHPAPGGPYDLFPSFGLRLDALETPLSIPTVMDELDHEGMAEAIGVDLSSRPYPERVLWQAFAYTGFDPHEETIPTLTQFTSGQIGLIVDRP